MGAAFTRLRVYMAAAVQSASDRIIARSFLSVLLSFTPQWTPAAVKPLGAVTPP
jgi:hypothetical protein